MKDSSRFKIGSKVRTLVDYYMADKGEIGIIVSKSMGFNDIVYKVKFLKKDRYSFRGIYFPEELEIL